MYCNQCGNELPDGARFCNKCGADLSGFSDTMQKSPYSAMAEIKINSLDDVYYNIDNFFKGIDAGTRLGFAIGLSLFAVIALLIGQHSISTSWIGAIASAILVAMILINRYENNRLLLLAITVFAARYIILDIVHIFGNENYHYQANVVILHMVIYGILALYWIDYYKVIAMHLIVVIMSLLYLMAIICQILCLSKEAGRGMTYVMFYLGCIAFMVSSGIIYSLKHEVGVKVRWLESIKKKIK